MGGYIIVPAINASNENDTSLIDNVTRAINAGKLVLYHTQTGELLAMNVESVSQAEVVIRAVTSGNSIITVTLGAKNMVETTAINE